MENKYKFDFYFMPALCRERKNIFMVIVTLKNDRRQKVYERLEAKRDVDVDGVKKGLHCCQK